ncbi:MAG: LCP family protein [Elainellaceae cyanobacterium]
MASITPPRTSTPRPSSRSWRWFWLALGLSGTAAFSAAAGALLAVGLTSTPLLQSSLSPDEEQIFGEGDRISATDFRMPRLTRPVNILVMGVKVLTSDLENPSRSAEDLGYHALVNDLDGLSDTMLLLGFDPADEKLAMLSLPRDTRTWVSGMGYTKLNEANREGGPALAASATSELLGDVSIDRYVRINVQGVEKLIDALGGVEVYVPYDMQYQDDSQHLYINLKEGQQRLNGDQALQILRYRYDGYGDIGRIQRQQTLIRALQEQALSPMTLTRLPKILSVIRENIDTNLSLEEVLALVGFASRMDRSEVQQLLLPGDFSEAGYELSYWLPDERAIDRMMAQHFSHGATLAALPSRGEVRIAIQDSTGDYYAIDDMIYRLEDAGYWNIVVVEDWREPLAETRIIAQQGDTRLASELQGVLSLGEVRTESTGSLQSDITIAIGQDWVEAGYEAEY